MVCLKSFTRLFSTPRRRAGAAARLAVFVVCALSAGGAALGQQYDPGLYSGLRWRLLGPFRAGRVTAVAGIAGRPAIYYMATPDGGVWKTTDGGQVWRPIFDEAHVSSVGALALAPSNPDIVYVGTGEETEGDGVYKSTDGGATWANVGLGETHHISSIIVDPRDPEVVLVGAFGDPVPSRERGVFKTNDGGKTWKQVFFPGDRLGVADMCAAPGDSRAIYAATWLLRSGPGAGQPESQIFKSADGGETWRQLSGAGLPEKSRGRIGVVAAAVDGRVYAIMNQGFFRSDDGGESWRQTTKDPRVVGSGFFSRVFADPKNPEVVYVMQTSTYRSTDGGKSFEAFKGTPSGEDDHVLWIAPEDPQRMIMGTDQGATVSLDGGRSWSLWYNQPTGQFYHVITDEQFPYYAYASQQDSGSVAVPNRSDFGQITFRDWFSTGAFESGYIAPDPLSPNLVYSIGWYGTVLRLDRATGQVSTVFIPGPKYRYTWETPLVFSPTDKKTLYVGTQNLIKTSDGAKTWQEVSPDLTQKAGARLALKTPAQLAHAGHVEEEAEDGEGQQRSEQGVILAITPSALRAGEIWVGTSSSQVQLTRDGGATWRDVAPPGLPAQSRVTRIESSPLDADTAYIVASARNDPHPYVYRTRDGGKTWQKIVTGLPERGVAHVVREDPARKSLLYAGTDNGVYVSFDGGDRWQPLQLNLPASPVRDLAVHAGDLVAATYGRGLWILDDLSPLRQLDAKVTASDAYLFRPADALRVRWDNWQETPLSPETPAGENPPDGAVIDYYLKSPPPKEITLEIRDGRGGVVRRYTSTPPPKDNTPANVPDYWFAPPAVLPAKAGLNRFVWDLRLPDPLTLPYNFYGRRIDYVEYTLPDHAVPGRTPRRQPPGPLAVPGNYEAVLTVGGKTYRQPLAVRLDPRVRVSQAELEAQLELAKKVSDMMAASYEAYNGLAPLRAALAERVKSLSGNPQAKDAADAAAALARELEEIAEGTGAGGGFGSVNRDMARLLTMVEGGDMRPAESASSAAAASCETLGKTLARLKKVSDEGLPALNKLLGQYNLAPLPAPAPAADARCGG